MKSKIALAFDNCKREKRPALITYTVAGDSTKEISIKILNKILSLIYPNNIYFNNIYSFINVISCKTESKIR